MGKVYSTTMEEVSNNNEFEATFEIENRGTENISVADEMLTNYEVTKDRAEAIFLEQSYTQKTLSVATYHIDNIHIGDIAEVGAELYVIESIVESLGSPEVSMVINMKRWE